MNTWTYADQMNFEADVRDSILAETGYFRSTPQYDDMREVDFYEFCDPLFNEF